MRGPDHGDLRLGGDTDLIAQLLERADGTRTAPALAIELGRNAAERRDVADAIAGLLAEGVLDDASAEEELLSEAELDRFQRQLAYFADLAGGSRGAALAQQRLGRATVCLLGLGGLGSWVAWALACAGVGKLVGVDGDHVETSNLNRQILYSEGDVGAQKTSAAGRRLMSFNTTLEYKAVDRVLDGVATIREVIRGAAVVVDSVDRPPHAITRWVAEACFAEAIPYIAVSQHPPLLRVGPLYVPGDTGCYACQEATYSHDFPLFESLRTSRSIKPPSATYGPACGVVGTLAANEVVAWLTGLYSPACLGRAALVDLRTFAVEFEPVERSADCAICGAQSQRVLDRESSPLP